MNIITALHGNASKQAKELQKFIADQNTGHFKGMVSTFSSQPQVVELPDTPELQNNMYAEHQVEVLTILRSIYNFVVENNVDVHEVPQHVFLLGNSDDNYSARVDNELAIHRLYTAKNWEVPEVIHCDITKKDNFVQFTNFVNNLMNSKKVVVAQENTDSVVNEQQIQENPEEILQKESKADSEDQVVEKIAEGKKAEE